MAMSKKQGNVRYVERQKRSLEFLESQLSSNSRVLGTKSALKYNLKHSTSKVKGDEVKLDDNDIKRVNKEIEILKTKLNLK